MSCHFLEIVKCAYQFLKDWQTVWVAVIVTAVAWYNWEINLLIQAATRNTKLLPRESRPANFDWGRLAGHLSHLPIQVAMRVLEGAYYRHSGKYLWKDYRDAFQKKHDSVRKNRSSLRKSSWI